MISQGHNHQIFITPEQLVIFIYNSLKGIAEFTPLNSDDE